jgi:alkanesulfonate monooxygenase SsuD/methylene tetrahydromethanopterin reductase-like flavin-dependent oxidoreductase (luciferase family)
LWRDESALDAEIVALEDDPEAIRVTVSVSVVVRVTREKVLDRFAREVFDARRAALSADDFTPLAYEAVWDEGLDDVTGGPTGQLRFLVDPAANQAHSQDSAVDDREPAGCTDLVC